MKFPILLPNIFNYPFTYESDLKLNVGDFVEVPFGKSKKTCVVWDNFEEKKNKDFKIKRVIKRIDVPRLNENIVKFLNWFSEYNIVPKGMALKLVLLSGQTVHKFDTKFYKNFDSKIKDYPLNLTKEQEDSLNKINKYNKKFNVHVLQGVTGSGKTIVYFEALKKILKQR